MGLDLFRHAPALPKIEPHIRMVPIAISGRAATPFSAIVFTPDDRFHRPSIFQPWPCATNVGRRDRRLDFRPLRVRQNLHRLSTPTLKPISCTVVAASQEMRTGPSRIDASACSTWPVLM